MNKTLIKNIQEYRQWAWNALEEHKDSQTVEEALGLIIGHDCWDCNDKNEPIDQQGNVIPEDTVDIVKLEDWVNELDFPLVAVYTFEKDWDRAGNYEVVMLDFVSLSEFTEVLVRS
jgi:hypothetical protein